MKFRVWFRALRVPFFTGTLLPVIFGTAYAYYETGIFKIDRFLFAFLGILFVQAGLNLANDYFDNLSGNDTFGKPTPFSGGSRVIQEGLLNPKTILVACIVCFICAILIGLYLNFRLRGNTVLIIGLAGMLLAYFYSAPPLKIGYRSGLAELACAIGCGPLLILGSYYVQLQTISSQALLASVPMGVLIGLILFINEFPDYKADRQAHKNNLVVLCGPKKASYIFVICLLLSYILTLFLIITAVFPALATVYFATIPLAYYITKKVLLNYSNIDKLLPANMSMIRLHILFSIIVTATFIIK